MTNLIFIMSAQANFSQTCRILGSAETVTIVLSDSGNFIEQSGEYQGDETSESITKSDKDTKVVAVENIDFEYSVFTYETKTVKVTIVNLGEMKQGTMLFTKDGTSKDLVQCSSNQQY